MKRTANYYILSLLSLSLVVPQAAFANVSVNVSGNSSNSNVNVHQEGSSQSTTCINGKCSTEGETGKTTVCHDGDCKTYEGDVNYESNDGHTKVNINNRSVSVTVAPRPTEVTEDENEVTEEPRRIHRSTTLTPAPSITVELKRNHPKNNEELKHMSKSHDTFLSNLLKNEFASIKSFFAKIF